MKKTESGQKLFVIRFYAASWVRSRHTNKKENKIFLIYKEIQKGSGAKSYMTKGLPSPHIRLNICAFPHILGNYIRKFFLSFLSVQHLLKTLF
jgi:hypothetical protein